MKSHHVCFSQSLACSGVDPCPACFETVKRYALEYALEYAGVTQQQANLFFAGIVVGWQQLHGQMAEDPEVVGYALDLDRVVIEPSPEPAPAPAPAAVRGFRVPASAVPTRKPSPPAEVVRENLQTTEAEAEEAEVEVDALQDLPPEVLQAAVARVLAERRAAAAAHLAQSASVEAPSEEADSFTAQEDFQMTFPLRPDRDEEVDNADVDADEAPLPAAATDLHDVADIPAAAVAVVAPEPPQASPPAAVVARGGAMTVEEIAETVSTVDPLHEPEAVTNGAGPRAL